jgi:hypothetical protein
MDIWCCIVCFHEQAGTDVASGAVASTNWSHVRCLRQLFVTESNYELAA